MNYTMYAEISVTFVILTSILVYDIFNPLATPYTVD